MPELGTYGSVRGAAGNSRPYRERRPITDGVDAHRGRRPKASREGNRERVGRDGAAGAMGIWPRRLVVARCRGAALAIR